MKSFTKSWLLFSALGLLLAIIISQVLSLTAISNEVVLLFFPGLWAFIDGTTSQTILLFVAITAVSYLVPGLIFTTIYIWLKKYFSNKKAFWMTLCIPTLILTGIVFSQYQQYRNFFHVGDTPEDCAALASDRQGWCYRTLYREYSIPEVCVHPGLAGNEAEECARRYGAKSGTIAACSVFQGKPAYYDDCRWGVAVIKKNISLCEQLPADDGYLEYHVKSTQQSCIEVIDKYWESNVNFYLHGI